jgi:peptidoglycan-associated lipoprotein
MKIWTKLAFTGALVAMSACTNPDRFSNPSDDDVAGLGQGVTGQTGVSDPTSPQYFSQTIGDKVLFVVDSASLTAAGQQTLDGQAQWLQTNVNYRAIIEGHADEQGTREYNLALGARRANAVREYLVSKGIDTGRLQTISYGKERPSAVCAAESCYSQNRRSVTVISVAGLNS